MKSKIYRVVLVSLGLVFALVTLEIYLRIFNPQDTISNFLNFEVPYSFNCFKPGTYYWIGLKENQTCILKSNGRAFPETIIQTNSIGLRNPEITLPKPKGVTRILFEGDSFTLGWGVNEHQAYPRVVGNILKVEAINAGLTASGPGYYYAFLKKQGLSFDPDIVVVGTYLFNDIPDDIYNSIWEEVNEDGLPEKIASNTKYIDPVRGYIFPKEIPLKYSIPYLRRSHLFPFIMDKITAGRQNTKIKEKVLDPRICFYKEECHSLDQAKEKFKKLFLGIKKLTDTYNKKLLVVLLPAEFQSDRNSRLKYIPIPLTPLEKDYPYQQFSKFFEENNIDYLDLRPAFTNALENGQRAHYKLDDHWNAEGHRIAAETISEKLKEYLSTLVE